LSFAQLAISSLTEKIALLACSPSWIVAVERRGTMERLAQCHCGSLRATTSGDPILVGICHCKACQRRTGALAGNGAAFAKTQVRIEGSSKVFERDGQAGRLTLNVLLSFAQFEREVAGERIRDKIATLSTWFPLWFRTPGV
jgi:hypothetical protein